MSNDSPPDAPALPDGTLLEGIVTTLDDDGTPHIAPMGPIVDGEFNVLLLRPFRTSTTYQNLKRTGQGVLHVTDDVELLARAAVGRLEHAAATSAGGSRRRSDPGRCLPLVCVSRRIARRSRRADANRRPRGRPRHVCASFLASIEPSTPSSKRRSWPRGSASWTRITFAANSSGLAVLVEKTGGHQERRAFAFLQDYLAEQLATHRGRASGVARPMTRSVHVRAPCRLHFGMFGFGRTSGPQLGGVGVMVEPPAVEVTIEPAANSP